MSIITLLNQIKNEEIVLPAIQRDFVWPKERVLRLLDSIVRAYPVGIALLWETYNDIQYRKFVVDYVPEADHSFRENPHHKRLKLVLDGQQRLQSLYIALYGTYGGKHLYFDVLSGRDSDDAAQDKYDFGFMDSREFENWKSQLTAQKNTLRDEKEAGSRVKYFVRVADLFALGPKDKRAFKQQVDETLHLPEDDLERLELNLNQFEHTLTKDPNILKVSVIDEDLPPGSPSRQSEADVLEIFVRVNRDGTPLNRSDLIFSMLKLNWRESAEDLPAFVKSVNEGNSFDFDTDFVIRCLFAVSDLGSKFDLELLRKKQNITKLRSNFSRCCDAIKSVVDFAQNECWCANSRALGGYNTLVPFVYYVFNLKTHEIPNSQIANVRKAMYLFGFARPFSRYADSRIARFIRDELRPSESKHIEEFPYRSAVWWVGYWEDIHSFGEKLLQANPTLALYVVQNLTGAKIQYRKNLRELDHIFPRSVLREKGYDEAEINNFANFWILAKGKNQNKSAKHPAKYFEDVEQSELDRALIDRDLLQYSKFRGFIRTRGQEILDRVKAKLIFSDEDFKFPETKVE